VPPGAEVVGSAPCVCVRDISCGDLKKSEGMLCTVVATVTLDLAILYVHDAC